MLVKVSYNEIVGQEHLAYALYSATGEPLYAVGEPVTPALLSELKARKTYRSSSELPLKDFVSDFIDHDFIDHEGRLIPVPSTPLTPQEWAEYEAEKAAGEQHAIYGPELASSFITSIQHFWDQMARGAPPDVALCEVVGEKMVAEVTSKVDQVHFLSQVRVRDEFTYSHILDVTALSIALAIKAGYDRNAVKEIALAAILHDMGKLLIPKAIMFKPSRLTEKEFQVMKLHPELGYKMLKDQMNIPDHIALPALQHQEMYGGGGYPLNLKGDEIHPYSHIVKIADVYDALTSKRPYKEPIPNSRAIKIMLSEGEKSFHPELLKHFVELSNYHDHADDDMERATAG